MFKCRAAAAVAVAARHGTSAHIRCESLGDSPLWLAAVPGDGGSGDGAQGPDGRAGGDVPPCRGGAIAKSLLGNLGDDSGGRRIIGRWDERIRPMQWEAAMLR